MFPNIAGAVEIKQALIAQAIAATADGTGVFVGNYEGTILAVLNSALASSGDTLAVVIKDSYDGVTYGTINADAVVDPATGDNDTFDTITDAANSGLQILAIKKDLVKPYLRMTFTVTGGSVSIPVSAIFICPRKSF